MQTRVIHAYDKRENDLASVVHHLNTCRGISACNVVAFYVVRVSDSETLESRVENTRESNISMSDDHRQ